jgi:acetoacetate decarboxylase
MGFVKTEQELSRYYALKVREFPDALMMGVMFAADDGLTRACLPAPLEQADVPGGLMFIAEYRSTNLGPGYREAALFLRCKYEGRPGSYCLSMPLDGDASRIFNGRDIYGFPKKEASIALEVGDTHAAGSVERRGIRFVEVDVALEGTLPELPPMGPTYLFKASPRADLEPGFDWPVLLVAQQTEITTRSIRIGPATVRFSPSESDPWSEFEGMTPLMGFVIESSNRMLPGKTLAEVDGEAFLPHYFKMTDLYCGEE